jgi:hypothetical protein
MKAEGSTHNVQILMNAIKKIVVMEESAHIVQVKRMTTTIVLAKFQAGAEVE